MDGKFSELEMLFISEVLDQHGEYLSDILVESIEKARLISDVQREHLIDSIAYRTTKYGTEPVLQLSFLTHGRFIEINYFKKRSQNTMSWIDNQKEAKAAIWGRTNAKRRKKKKDTRWYAKNVYGSLNRLISILMYEFTEEERARLKNILDKNNKVS